MSPTIRRAGYRPQSTCGPTCSMMTRLRPSIGFIKLVYSPCFRPALLRTIAHAIKRLTQKASHSVLVSLRVLLVARHERVTHCRSVASGRPVRRDARSILQVVGASRKPMDAAARRRAKRSIGTLTRHEGRRWRVSGWHEVQPPRFNMTLTGYIAPEDPLGFALPFVLSPVKLIYLEN